MKVIYKETKCPVRKTMLFGELNWGDAFQRGLASGLYIKQNNVQAVELQTGTMIGVSSLAAVYCVEAEVHYTPIYE